MSEDRKENNVIDFVAYREERLREEKEEKDTFNQEQERYFLEDYATISNPHVMIDGQIYNVEDILTPEQSADMVDTIMHMLKLLDERDRILSDTLTDTDNNSDNNIEEDE
mgnify:CR=1 FL=1